MGYLFLFISPYFILELGPGCLYLSLFVMDVVPCWERTYVVIQY